MRVNPGDSDSEKLMLLEKRENLIVVRSDRGRHLLKIAEDLQPRSQVPASDLADHKWVHQHQAVEERLAELGISAPKMIHPDRGVDQYHRAEVFVCRRGAARKWGCVPPNAARRRAASRAINACNPARMSAVFSLIPVRRVASLMRSSSIFSVLLICISMHP